MLKRMRMAAFLATLAAAAPIAVSLADAKTLRWARSQDALTLDPHAQNEGATYNLLHSIYEPMILRDRDGSLLPTLAHSRRCAGDPTVWEFKLRPNVKFHGGETMTADDVVFSLGRAQQPTSGVKGLLTAIDSVSKVDNLTIRIKTKGPNPLLPTYLTNIFVMSKAWAEANNSVTVQDFKEKKDNFAVRNANGTGPYTLVSREQDVKTVMKRFEGYWGKGTFPLGVTEISYVTIKSDATRIAALLSGEVDFVQDVPVQDIDRLTKTANIRVNLGPENRSIFLGFNVGTGELASSDVKGKNPSTARRSRRR